jgi:hypothetical protein
MDAIWRGESILQGKYVLATIAAPYNCPNVESLEQWNSNGKSLIAQKLVQVINVGIVLIGISVDSIRKLSGVLMTRN